MPTAHEMRFLTFEPERFPLNLKNNVTAALFTRRHQPMHALNPERTDCCKQPASTLHASPPGQRRSWDDTFNPFPFSNIASSPAQRLHTLTNPHGLLNTSSHRWDTTHVLPLTRIFGLNRAMHAASFTASQPTVSWMLISKPATTIRHSSMHLIIERAQ